MKKAYIFDLNGVFILSPKLSDRFREAFGIQAEYFLPALKEIMAKVRMPGANNIYSYWQPYLQKWGLEIKEQTFLDFWFNAETENTEMVTLARELKEKGARLFILSNNLRERSAYYDEHFQFLNELFEKEYYSWVTGFIKPDPRCYETLLKENNLKPEECMYFDDSEENVAVAKELGIESHVYDSPAQVRKLVV
jgi:HAD superfamily hydrolase (TIGR01509 family)